MWVIQPYVLFICFLFIGVLTADKHCKCGRSAKLTYGRKEMTGGPNTCGTRAKFICKGQGFYPFPYSEQICTEEGWIPSSSTPIWCDTAKCPMLTCEHGACKGGAVCECEPGWIGDRCDLNIEHECRHIECFNGGTCDLYKDIGMPYCVCKPFYGDYQCSTYNSEDPCFDMICGFGECVYDEENNTRKCKCEKNWHGPQCFEYTVPQNIDWESLGWDNMNVR
ncbi:unnamed protein product [Owenia fusiformis]|uniref:Uncharacterized protein n=1 Tax=Owenia fusiformis TaxID=6347 RepID=A0A8J1UTR5_OWEFU|nr:unnamed protein product [Owenia fusiformis]